MGNFPLSFLPLVHFLIEFSRYNLPSQSCGEHHIAEVHGVAPPPFLPELLLKPKLCMFTEYSGVTRDSCTICPRPLLSCQGLHSTVLQLLPEQLFQLAEL